MSAGKVGEAAWRDIMAVVGQKLAIILPKMEKKEKDDGPWYWI